MMMMMMMNEWMNEWMRYFDEIEFSSKNQTITMNQFEEKWENLIFEGIKGIKGLFKKSAWNIFSAYPCSI